VPQFSWQTNSFEHSACEVIELHNWRAVAKHSISPAAPLFQIHSQEKQDIAGKWPMGRTIALAFLTSALLWTFVGGLVYLAI
jgi:hypothetical protein